MTDAEFRGLRPGDIVRNVTYAVSFRVSRVDDGRVKVVREFDLGNPAEWDLVLKASHRPLAGRVARQGTVETPER